jgi:hypothetical protein
MRMMRELRAMLGVAVCSIEQTHDVDYTRLEAFHAVRLISRVASTTVGGE